MLLISRLVADLLLLLTTLAQSSESKAIKPESGDDYSTSFSSESGESLCSTVPHTINPDDLINSLQSKHKWEFDERFQQTIEVKKCENANGPCIGYPFIKTRCRQRYLTIQLLVFRQNKQLSQLKKFRIPSDCECVI